MGATGNDRGAEGLSEVQESVLEHSTEETYSPQALDDSVQQKDGAEEWRMEYVPGLLNGLGSTSV
jgi:hypothetical protein